MSQNRVIAVAVAATASTSLILAGIIFFFFYRFSMARQQRERSKHSSSFRRETVPPVIGHDEELMMQNGGTLRGLLVEENGRDVLYLRRADDAGGRFTGCFSKVWFNPIMEEDKEMIEDRGLKPSISSPIQEVPLISMATDPHAIDYFPEVDKPMEVSGPLNLAPPPAPPPPVVPSRQTPPPPPPPPQPPPPPPPPPLRNNLTPPQPPPLPPLKRASKPPVPQIQPKPGGISSSLKVPSAPPKRNDQTTKDSVETPDPQNPKDRRDAQLKLKPLHWDKVPTNAEHSMVWHEIVDGSFRVDDKLMESLFGYNARNQKTPEARKNMSANSASSGAAAQINLLDPRKSQNTAIVIKSLAISRKEILDAIQEGYGLSTDVLEKLTKISPSPEEAAKILQFNGNPTKLADAESFLYHILKAVPSAFIRINAMLFRSSYDPDILHLKESLQTLEFGCRELRNRGIFLKILEAILKAGNLMNAGTARGDAQGFNLSALQKLSYVKSTDGKTTLLHFVIEQVIRSEGKRCCTNNQKNSKFDQDLRTKTIKEENEKEYMMLGLPIVGGLSTELSNVKKAAAIDYESFINMCPTLTMRANDIRQLVLRCGSSSEKSGFVTEMRGFVEECEEELKVVREEQTRVMQLVKRTTEYYQAGGAKEKGTDPLQLFGIVKNFLAMVDQVCVDISKKLKKKRVISEGSSPPSSPPLPLSPKTPVKFQNFLQSYFQTGKQGTMSSESDDDF